jgi:hypothetical protein
MLTGSLQANMTQEGEQGTRKRVVLMSRWLDIILTLWAKPGSTSKRKANTSGGNDGGWDFWKYLSSGRRADSICPTLNYAKAGSGPSTLTTSAPATVSKKTVFTVTKFEQMAHDWHRGEKLLYGTYQNRASNLYPVRRSG